MKKGLILGVRLNVAQITCSLFSFRILIQQLKVSKNYEKDLFCQGAKDN
jgi:hypothetical protein